MNGSHKYAPPTSISQIPPIMSGGFPRPVLTNDAEITSTYMKLYVCSYPFAMHSYEHSSGPGFTSFQPDLEKQVADDLAIESLVRENSNVYLFALILLCWTFLLWVPISTSIQVPGVRTCVGSLRLIHLFLRTVHMDVVSPLQLRSPEGSGYGRKSVAP